MGTRPGSFVYFVPSVPSVPSIPFCAFLLLLVLFPSISHANIVVAEPTGDADAVFVAELKASLEIVAAEAPAEMDAELRTSASNNEAGWELVVELAPKDGQEPIRETRIVSKASALSQARAMERAVIAAFRSAASAAPETTPEVVVATPVTAPSPQEVTPPAEPPKAPPPPPLPEKHSRRSALLMTLLPTALLPPIGAGILNLGFLASSYKGAMSCIISGASVAGLGLVFGPSTGYFWVGRWRHALMMSGIRLLTLATGVGTMFWYVAGSMHDSDEENPCEDDMGQRIEGCNQDEPSPVLLAFSIMSLTAIVFLSYIDAGLVGRAADRANEQYRKSLQITAAPVAWSSGNGDRTFGLALRGSF
ncbi:MAG: hypothetical protein M0R80_14145 [Proteobacteria bacterium]|jgi:hypothetical protein|nr:hypothetical protein [Pseudomonadota bacterium]